MPARTARVYDLGGALEPSVIRFVELHVSSLLTWDVLAYFHSNPAAAVDVEGLAALLGRKTDELEPEVRALCESSILHEDDQTIRYRPSDDLQNDISAFAQSCQDPVHRLSLIAMVLQKTGRPV